MKVVLANGTFDPYHVGHLYHFQAAKRLGDLLIVSITCDESVRREKGSKRPAYTELQRADVIRNIKCVDGVVIVTDALDALKKVNPAIFVKGSEYRGRIEPLHRAYCMEHRIEIAFTDTEKFSSTRLLSHYAGR